MLCQCYESISCDTPVAKESIDEAKLQTNLFCYDSMQTAAHGWEEAVSSTITTSGVRQG
jgi:hypothetical protein